VGSAGTGLLSPLGWPFEGVMTTDIKICGLRDVATLDAALDAGADYVGFVFFPRSPRNVSLAEGEALVRHARGSATTVALVVDPTAEDLTRLMDTVAPDAVQFHGRESPALLADFRSRYGAEIWKAVPVSTADDLAPLAVYLAATDRILFDAKAPKDADRPGGHGRAFDWSVLHGLDRELGFMLSGGLDVHNVGDAIRQTRAGAVDVSSGVETAPGEKSPDLIRAFINAVRDADARQESRAS
jgi:phosphoribosylanthranilate isomerase